MSKTLKREYCPNCQSKDNLTTWEYEGKIMKKCQTSNCQKLKILMTKDIEYMEKVAKERHNTGKNDTKLSQSDSIVQKSELLTGEYKATRGLTKETCEACGIMMQGENHIFQYNNAQKIRFPKPDGTKGMYWVGDHSQAGLFLEGKEYDTRRELIITEGEFDAASIVQTGYQAYSIRNGAGEKKTAEEIRINFLLLSTFREIIFWFDQDTAGQKALKEVLEVEGLPLHKFKIVKTLGFKDANEALLESTLDENFVRLAIDAAEDYIPEGIIRGDQIDFSVLEEAEEPGIEFMFPELQKCYHGLRKSETLLIGAASGAGKTCFTKAQSLYWMKKYPALRISFMFLEESSKFTLQSLTAMELQIPAYKIVEEPYQGLSNEGQRLLGKKQYYFDEHFGSLQSKKLFKKLKYLSHKTDLIVIDHISIIVSGLEGNDERKDIDRLMTLIKTLQMETGVRFVIISHLSRGTGQQTYEEGLKITTNSFRGSHSLVQLSNAVIALERNQQSPSDKNKSAIRALKGRFIGTTGVLDQYVFDEDKGIITTMNQIFNN